MATVREQLAKAFHETQSFKWDPDKGFKLASGLTSPFYVDCRSLMAHPGARRLVAQLAYEALRPVECDCLGGLEIGAISIATSISDYAFAAQPSREWRTFVVRKQAKDHGLGKLIEGAARSGDRAHRGYPPGHGGSRAHHADTLPGRLLFQPGLRHRLQQKREHAHRGAEHERGNQSRRPRVPRPANLVSRPVGPTDDRLR